MTVNTTNITSGPYAGNGITTAFSYTFRIDTKNDIAVYETDDSGVQTLLVVDADYTLTGVGDDAAGTVTRVAGALPTNFTWYIRSDYDNTQLTAFESQGGFFPNVHESALDKSTFQTQQINDKLNRSLRIDVSDETGEMLPLAKLTANAFLQVNETANGFDTVTLGAVGVTAEIPLASYDDFRNGVGFTIGDHPDGQIIWITNDSVIGSFRLKTGATPADDGGHVIRSNIDTNRYIKRTEVYTAKAENFSTTIDAVSSGVPSSVLQVDLNNQSVGSGKIEIPTTYSMRMKGVGSAESILSFTHTDNTHCIHQGSGGSDRFIRYFENFKIQGGSQTGHGIHFEQPAVGPHLRDIWVTDCSGSGKAGLKFEDCFIGIADDLKLFNNDIGIDMVRAKGIIGRGHWNADNDLGIRIDDQCNGNDLEMIELGLATIDPNKKALDCSGFSNRIKVQFYENYSAPRALDLRPLSYGNIIELLNASTLSIWDDGFFNHYPVSNSTQLLNLSSGFGFAGPNISSGNDTENRYSDSSWKNGATGVKWNPFGATAPVRSFDSTQGYLDSNSMKLDWGTTALSGVESIQEWLVNEDDFVSVMLMVRVDRNLESTEQLVFKIHGGANENREVQYNSDLRAGQWTPVLLTYRSLATESIALNITLDAGGTHTALLTWIDDVVVQVNKKTIGLLQNNILNTNITAITQANPAVVTSTAHGLTSGDRVTISGVVGMTEINSSSLRTVTVVDADNVNINGVDSTLFTAYTSGGTLSAVKTFSKNTGALIPKATFNSACIDAGDQTAAIPGILATNAAVQATTGVVEEVLVTHNIPAYSLWKNGMGVKIKAWGVTAANANTKQLRIRFGGLTGTVVADTGSPGANNKTWTLEATILRTGGATQIFMGEAIANDSVRPPVSGNDFEDLLTDTDLVVTGLTASGAGDATYSGSVVELISKV